MPEKDLNEKFRVATLRLDNVDLDVYLLNPGDHFSGFGGSRSGLDVRKTASLVTRRRSIHGWSDMEYDVNDQKTWGYLLYLMQRKEAEVLAAAPFTPEV